MSANKNGVHVTDIFQSTIDTLNDLASEVIEERLEQVQQWGQQDHPSSHRFALPSYYETQADRYKEINDARVADGSLSWDGILLEEVFEALAESDPQARRTELIQVAAVALAEVEAIDRRESASPEPEPEADAKEAA